MPLTEERLRAAAMRAVAEPGVQAVVLFGSRARKTHRKASDWDVCVVGVGDRARAEQALGLAFEECGGHLVARHAEVLERHSATQDTETARELVRAMARLAGRMNGGTQRAHNALYHGQADPEKTWRERVFHAMATHSALIEGLLAGEGPLAGLKQHARRQAFTATMRQAARDARETRNEFSKRYGGDADEVVITKMEQWCQNAQRAATHTTVFDVDVEDALESLVGMSAHLAIVHNCTPNTGRAVVLGTFAYGVVQCIRYVNVFIKVSGNERQG